MAKSSIDFRLKGHEKFVLREGWLNKGLQVIDNNKSENGMSRIFLDDRAPDELGVGSNMVKSIRYWLRAFGLTDEVLGKGVRLSTFGHMIIANDPYLEDINTLWLLHSTIARNTDTATVWYLFFNKCDIDEFTKGEIEFILDRELKKYIGHDNYSEGSLKDDTDVLLNMYCKEKVDNYDPEDKNVCPLSALRLIKKSKNGYQRTQPDLNEINEMIILYVLMSLFENESSLSIDRISTGDMGLGKIFNLNRISINSYLDKLEHMGYVRINRTAGLDVVYLTSDTPKDEIIQEYYNAHRQG